MTRLHLPMAMAPSSRVLTVDPTARGFGFAVFEGPNALVDWGLKEFRKQTHESCVRHVAGLFWRCRPQVLVVEDLRQGWRSIRVRDLLAGFVELARAEGLRAVFVTRAQVARVFVLRGARTRDDIAAILAEDFPELAGRLPPPRRIGRREDPRIRIFGAVAMALTYFSIKKKDGRYRPSGQTP